MISCLPYPPLETAMLPSLAAWDSGTDGHTKKSNNVKTVCNDLASQHQSY